MILIRLALLILLTPTGNGVELAAHLLHHGQGSLAD
jgi:hypothetical protein